MSLLPPLEGVLLGGGAAAADAYRQQREGGTQSLPATASLSPLLPRNYNAIKAARDRQLLAPAAAAAASTNRKL